MVELIVIIMNEQPYYKLRIFIDPVLVEPETYAKYKEQIIAQQQLVDKYKIMGTEWDFPTDEHEWPHIDAGFDLFTPSCLE